jgi:hypothetical protein
MLPKHCMIDTGVGRDIDMHLKTLLAFVPALTSYSKGTPVAGLLACQENFAAVPGHVRLATIWISDTS